MPTAQLLADLQSGLGYGVALVWAIGVLLCLGSSIVSVSGTPRRTFR